MKTFLAAFVLLGVAVVAGYFGIPFLFRGATSEIRTDINRLKQRIERIEAFVKSEEEVRKAGGLQPDAGTQRIVKAVNMLSFRITSLEASLNKRMSSTEEQLRAQNEALMKEAREREELKKSTEEAMQKISFDARLTALRGHIEKMRADMLSKNIATAKNEMELIDGTLERMKTAVAGDKKETIEELQVALREARTEADANVPAALSRVELLWHETSKMLTSAP